MVWAALRLRASLISSFPIDVYRRVNGYQVETPVPMVLRFPGGPRVTLREWIYSSQIDLDRTGNCFGIISQRDGQGLPARIDLVSATEVAVVKEAGVLIGFRIRGVLYAPEDIWHEKAFTIPGLDIGLSPVAYASWCLGTYASLDQWAVEYLDNATTPSVVLKNTTKQLNDVQAREMKDKYRASVGNGDAFVVGADWETQFLKMDPTGINWLAAKQYSAEEIARFFDVPHDLLDIASSGSAGSARMTYANLQQRNMQFLIMNLQPAIQRREEALSNGMLPSGATMTDDRANRYVKMNTDSLLRLDALGRAQLSDLRLGNHTATVTEVRELENLPPLTSAQVQEMKDMASISAAAGPPVPVANPNAKGLSARAARDYVPIDTIDGGLGNVGGVTITADQAHCQQCHDGIDMVARSIETILPGPGVSQVDDAGDPCACPPGCSCNPIGVGCIYAVCPCDAPQTAAQPTYTPPGTQPVYQGEGHFVLPA